VPVDFSRRRDDERALPVLLLSSKTSFLEQLRARLEPLRWEIYEARSGAEALEVLHEKGTIEVLLLDPVLPDLLPTEFCGMVRERYPEIEILTMNTQTGHLLVSSSAPTPIASQLADLLYNRAPAPALKALTLETVLAREPSDAPRLRGMVGDSAAMRRTYALVHKVAPRDTTVLVTGESGTGKDLIAQEIHMISARRKSPFVVVNCAAIPEALLEAELFGYSKGAFTGAMQSRIGRIHAAQGGTLFLDEIGDMPLALQSKILRFLEQGEVQRLGSNDNLKVDVRVVAATNAPLLKLVKDKLFREDLYYRLNVFPITLAPLRERDGDVAKLAAFFAEKFCPGIEIAPDALDALERHEWPGNVRELRNVMERASIMLGQSRAITGAEILI
jgi:DNA-binding NtrC family response regulator